MKPTGVFGDRPLSKKWPLFSVMLIYEDKVSGLLAKQVLDRVLRQAHVVEDTELQLCRLGLLSHDTLRMRAAQLAAKSDFLLLSFRARKRIPEFLAEWLKEWERLLAGGGNLEAVAVILHLSSDDQSQGFMPWLEDLKRNAERHRLRYYQTMHSTRTGRSSLDRLDSGQSVQFGENGAMQGKSEMPLPVILKKPMRDSNPSLHWGINE